MSTGYDRDIWKATTQSAEFLGEIAKELRRMNDLEEIRIQADISSTYKPRLKDLYDEYKSV